MKTCEFQDCPREVHAAALCKAHYRQYLEGGKSKGVLKPLRLFEFGSGCSFPKCAHPHSAKGLCRTHYVQYRDRGFDRSKLTPIRGGGKPLGTCRVASCGRVAYAKRLCNTHYRQNLKGEEFKAVKEYVRRCPTGICIIPGCEKLEEIRRMCKNHHRISFKYNLTGEELAEILGRGCCDSCGDTVGLTVDHDHKCCDRAGSCGECVRGLLCSQCNTALGLLRDDLGRINSLLEYLTEHKK